MNNTIYKYIYLICYFGIVILFSLRASKVIERVGKILTPILLLLLFLIIVKGIFFSGLSIKPDIYPHAFKKGFLEGYQTMDTIASIAYAGIILKAIKNGRDLTQKQEYIFFNKSWSCGYTIISFNIWRLCTCWSKNALCFGYK
ncbi:Branched chain amino acid transport system II carrier protein [Fusobacterium vincentii ATCC 49256]|uniref:Branched chain amino acid transport system II carrier protein n=1 Tax=Fusobacterium vincentii ATCC 49256 TaxID=209882 RepID=Q7P3H9_FUSVC|nr:Branched chain amino acid transport system II carrier protein [Fusobacterium vincentii ATCC 49256]